MQSNENPEGGEAEKTRRRSRAADINFVVNLVSLIVSTMNVFVIRGDGPNGFGEFALKGLVFMASIVFFIASSISLRAIERGKSPRSFPTWVNHFSTFWLLVFALFAIVDACSDQGGYCRRDGIHLQ